MIAECVARGAELVVLPECFNSPYGTKYFPEYAEVLDLSSPTVSSMSAAAREHNIWLVAGSFPERRHTKEESSQLYNTCVTYNPSGEIAGVHRKVHLFRIDTETVKMNEADVLAAGDSATPVTFTSGKHTNTSFGVGICFDIRFPQMAWHYQRQNTSFLVYPGAFNMVTGPAHWTLMAQARAIDTQQFVVLCSPARDPHAGYVAYGHSCVVDPWGTVIAELDEKEGVIVVEMDLKRISDVRQQLPILSGQRDDLYTLSWRSTGESH